MMLWDKIFKSNIISLADAVEITNAVLEKLENIEIDISENEFIEMVAKQTHIYYRKGN